MSETEVFALSSVTTLVHHEDPERIVLRQVTIDGETRHYSMHLEGFTRLALQLAAHSRHLETAGARPGSPT